MADLIPWTPPTGGGSFVAGFIKYFVIAWVGAALMAGVLYGGIFLLGAILFWATGVIH